MSSDEKVIVLFICLVSLILVYFIWANCGTEKRHCMSLCPTSDADVDARVRCLEICMKDD